MQRVRTISSSGRKSPGARPPFLTISVPPLPPRDPLISPILRSISPRSNSTPSPSLTRFSSVISDQSKSYISQSVPDVQRPLSHVPRQESYSLIQYDSIRSGRTTPAQSISAISDRHFQPHDLTGQITPDNMYIVACGGYGDVWKGSLWLGTEIHKVAIKVLRPPSEADRQKANKRLRREIDVWRRLIHENVVRLLGTAADFGPCIGMVSPWIDNGNLNAFLPKMSATLSLLNRIQLLCDVAAGLDYLHSNSVIHGDLTGANILINSDGKALLVDFGLSTIIAEFEGTSYYSSTVGGALRWRAPELLSLSEDDDVAPNLNTSCDIYSYGSVMLQVLTGQVPYHYLSDNGVFYSLSRGFRPRRPLEPLVTDKYWKFIQLCWSWAQDARPSIEAVNNRVTRFRRECMDASLNVQQDPVPLPFQVTNRHLRPIIRSTDGYESDSESLHVLGPKPKYSGSLSEQEGCTSRRKLGNKSRTIRPGTLTLVNNLRSQRQMALPKTRTISFRTLSSQHRESLNREVISLATASHSNIRNVISIERTDFICLTLEPIIGMPLSDVLRRSSLTNDQVSGLCSKIVNGLRHLHQLDVIHGNLNSSNVILDSQGCVKLSDFGLSAKIERELSNRIDSPYWSAPEFIISGKYAPAMDIWSLGIISIEMVEKHPPYFDKDPHTARELIAAGGTPTLKDWQAFPWELVRFLSSCLVGNVLERATASELALHEFLANACSTMGLVSLLDVDMQRAC